MSRVMGFVIFLFQFSFIFRCLSLSLVWFGLVSFALWPLAFRVAIQVCAKGKVKAQAHQM